MKPSVGVQSLVRDSGLDVDRVYELARRSLEEDLAGGADVTTEATVPSGHESLGDVVARADGVLAGIPVAAAVFDLRLRREASSGDDGAVVGHAAAREQDPMAARSAGVRAIRRDGEWVTPGDVVLTVTGPTRELLTAERCALNLLSHLSGVATLSRRWADAISATDAVVRDTRKTTPGLRQLEKYAVRCGGGRNHRMGLSHAALIKDNHVRVAGGVGPALDSVRKQVPGVECEVECDTVEEVRAALHAGAQLILLDNMSLTDMRAAVVLARSYGAATEASGGLTLDNAAAVATTGVDFLAVGALTHSAPVLDLAFDLQ